MNEKGWHHEIQQARAVTQIQKVNDKWKNSFTYRSEGDLCIRMGCNRIIYMRRAMGDG